MAEFSSFNGYTVKDAIARNIAKGRNQALAYSDYATMVETLNAMDNEQFKVGQNIYIGTVGVPDLWVYSIEPVSHDYNHVSDEATVELLKNNGTIQVGYYKLAMLEGQKVDLTPVNAQLSEHENAIAANTNAISEQNKNLTASDNLKFQFATDGEGNYGYLGADDSFIPFKSGCTLLKTIKQGGTYTTNKDCIIVACGAGSSSSNASERSAVTTNGGTLTQLSSVTATDGGRYNVERVYSLKTNGANVTITAFNHATTLCAIIG